MSLSFRVHYVNREYRSGQMSQWVKKCAAKPNHRRSIPGTHKNWLSKVAFWSPQVGCDKHHHSTPLPATHTSNIKKKKNAAGCGWATPVILAPGRSGRKITSSSQVKRYTWHSCCTEASLGYMARLFQKEIGGYGQHDNSQPPVLPVLGNLMTSHSILEEYQEVHDLVFLEINSHSEIPL